MNRAMIEELVEAVFRSNLPAKTLPMEVNVRAALQQCALECFEEAAKVCDGRCA